MSANLTEPGPTIGEEQAGENFGRQSHEHSCAISCQEYIIECYTGHDVHEASLISEAIDMGWYVPEGEDSPAGTPMEDVGNLLDLHGIPTNRYIHANVFHLTAELAQGHKVILGIDPEMLAGHPIFSEIHSALETSDFNHNVIVSGIDTTNPDHATVIVSDPATGQAAAHYPMDRFVAAWSTSDFFMVATQEPAPAWLPEMKNFDYEAGHIDTVAGMPYDEFLQLENSPDVLAAHLAQRAPAEAHGHEPGVDQDGSQGEHVTSATHGPDRAHHEAGTHDGQGQGHHEEAHSEHDHHTGGPGTVHPTGGHIGAVHHPGGHPGTVHHTGGHTGTGHHAGGNDGRDHHAAIRDLLDGTDKDTHGNGGRPGLNDDIHGHNAGGHGTHRHDAGFHDLLHGPAGDAHGDGAFVGHDDIHGYHVGDHATHRHDAEFHDLLHGPAGDTHGTGAFEGLHEDIHGFNAVGHVGHDHDVGFHDLVGHDGRADFHSDLHAPHLEDLFGLSDTQADHHAGPGEDPLYDDDAHSSDFPSEDT
jgi:hypothetical protein